MPKLSLYARCRALVIGAMTGAVVCVAAPAAAQPPMPPPCAACVVFVVDPAVAQALDVPLHGLEVLVRAATAADRELLAAARALRRAGGRPGVLLPPSAVALVDGATFAEMTRIVLDLSDELAHGEALSFRARTVLSQLRGLAPHASVGALAARDVIRDLVGGGLGPYLDFAAAMSQEVPAWAFVPDDGVAPIGTVWPVDAGDGPLDAPPTRWLASVPPDPAAALRSIGEVARAAPLLGERLVGEGLVDVRCGDRPQRTYLDADTLDTIAVVRGCDGGDIAVEAGGGSIERVVLASGATIVRVPAPEGVFAEGVQVRGERALTAREIVARHQAAAARQRREVRTLVSAGDMTLTFEAPGFPAPMTITSETVIFAGPDRVEIEQRDIRVNGLAFRAGGVPRLPIVEPERAASPPLEITLSEVYRYELVGEAETAGVPCYIVAFEPLDRRASLFAGRAWIAKRSFALVRVAAVQTGLRGPIVASEQIDEFRREGDAAWLLARSEVRQLYEGAGHRTPIHRVLTIRHHEINSAAFEARRRAAYASASVMLRDTPEGFRYLRRDPGAGPDAAPPAMAGRAVSVRTVALGALFDPNISRPLPFAGVSYVHFDLFGRGGQLSGFFGGTYGQLALSLPSIAGTRWQAGARAFGIASAYNDRAFVEGRELYRANIAQRPAHASTWLLRPLTDRLAGRVGYTLDYTHFGRSGSTAATFTVPPAQVAHGLSLALQGQWEGFDASVWWTGSVRTGWREWGEGADASHALGLDVYDPRHRTYQRYGVTIGRSWIASRRLVGRVEAAWMDGHDLDRFSRYTFGSFDNRLRGYPAALIRYDRGGVVRTTAAWSAGRLLRLDGFADAAIVRDPGFGPRAKRYVGAGFAAEVPGPFGTLVGVEWGYGFHGINTDGSRGTQVVRVTGYKMF